MVDAADRTEPSIDARNLGPIAGTLLITLWARAAESRRPDALRRDPVAEALEPRIDHDFSRYRRGWKTQVGVAVRGRLLDAEIEAFAERHPAGVVVDLGAGLDGRSRRLGGPELDWVLVDLPEVLELRSRLLPPRPNEHFVPGRAETGAWLEAADGLGDRPRLVVAEGLLMFLPRDAVAGLLGRIAGHWPGVRFVGDAIGGLMVRFPWLHDTLPGHRVRFAWGLRHPNEPEAWDARLRIERVWPLVAEGGWRWRWMRLLRHVPPMRRQFVLLRLRCGTAASA